MRLKEWFAPRDMTQGVPWKRVLEFALPMLIGNVAQQLYNTADSVIVGRYVGDNALAAVGSASPVFNLLLSVFVGIATGAGIVISQSFGAKDRKALSRNVGNCLTMSAIATVIIMIIGPQLTMPLLRLLDTPETIIYWCADYLKIFFWGISGFFFYNMLAGVLRGLGDSLSALAFLLLAAALNVGLDLLFVARFNMGVAGVALATILAQGISAVLSAIKLLRMRDVFDLNLDTLKLRKENVMHILRVGIPAGITQGIMAVSFVTVQSITNKMGEIVIACNVIIMRVDGFAMMPNMSFGNAMSVFTGQNVGAGKLDRVHEGTKQGVILSVCCSAVITTILLFFGKYLFAIFTTTPELIDLAVRMMRILAVGYVCISVTQALGGVMRGAGDTVTPMWISMISTIFLRVPTAFLLAHLTANPQWPNGQPFGMFTSLMFSWTVGMIMSIIAFRRGKWKLRMQQSMERARAGLQEQKEGVLEA